MTISLNPARITCPELVAGRRCSTSGCPFNHSAPAKPVGFSGSAIANSESVRGLTGAKGQFTGSSKGANSVPVKNTGELPAFVQSHLKSLNSPSSAGVSQQASYSQRQVDAPRSGHQSENRSGGNQRDVRLVDQMARIPANRPRQVAPVVDWKAEAVKARPARDRLSQDLSELLRAKETHRGEIQSLDDEIEELQQKIREYQPTVSSTDKRKYQQVSIELMKVKERSDLLGVMLDEQEELHNQTISTIRECGLIDIREYCSEQSRLLAQMRELSERFQSNADRMSADFRAATVIRMRTPSQPPAPQNLSPMLRIKEDFASRDDHALSVSRGELVKARSRQGGFVYVERKNGEQGWIPLKICLET